MNRMMTIKSGKQIKKKEHYGKKKEVNTNN